MFALPAFDTFLAFSIVRFQPPDLLSQLFNFSRTIILRPLLFCFPFLSFSHPGFCLTKFITVLWRDRMIFCEFEAQKPGYVRQGRSARSYGSTRFAHLYWGKQSPSIRRILPSRNLFRVLGCQEDGSKLIASQSRSHRIYIGEYSLVSGLCISHDHIDLTDVDLKSTHRVLCIRKLLLRYEIYLLLLHQRSITFSYFLDMAQQKHDDSRARANAD